MGGYGLSLLPGRNPAGTNVAGDYNLAGITPTSGVGSTSGANPYLPAPNVPASAPVSSNPYGNFPANMGGISPVSLTGASQPGLPSAGIAAPGTPGAIGGPTSLQGAQTGALGSIFQGMTQKGINDMFHELNKTYGEGTASLIMSFLMSGAGFNQTAVNNLFAAMQPQVERGTESIVNQFSAMGERFGSDAMLGVSDYLSQVNLNQAQIETQMYEQSINDFLNTLMTAGGTSAKRIAASPGTFDNILSAMRLAGTGITGGVQAYQGTPSGASGLQNFLSTVGGAMGGPDVVT